MAETSPSTETLAELLAALRRRDAVRIPQPIDTAAGTSGVDPLEEAARQFGAESIDFNGPPESVGALNITELEGALDLTGRDLSPAPGGIEIGPRPDVELPELTEPTADKLPLRDVPDEQADLLTADTEDAAVMASPAGGDSQAALTAPDGESPAMAESAQGGTWDFTSLDDTSPTMGKPPKAGDIGGSLPASRPDSLTLPDKPIVSDVERAAAEEASRIDLVGSPEEFEIGADSEAELEPERPDTAESQAAEEPDSPDEIELPQQEGSEPIEMDSAEPELIEGDEQRQPDPMGIEASLPQPIEAEDHDGAEEPVQLGDAAPDPIVAGEPATPPEPIETDEAGSREALEVGGDEPVALERRDDAEASAPEPTDAPADENAAQLTVALEQIKAQIAAIEDQIGQASDGPSSEPAVEAKPGPDRVSAIVERVERHERTTNAIIDRMTQQASISLPDDPEDDDDSLDADLEQQYAQVESTPMPEPELLPDDTDNGFWAKITGNAEADSPAQNRWVYAWEEVYKATSSYGGWLAVDGGRSGTTSTNPARNTIEDMNTASDAASPTVQGNGVDIDGTAFPSSFDVIAAPSGVLVKLRLVHFTVSGSYHTEYWFAYENGIDGGC